MSGLDQGFVRYREIPVNLPRVLRASEFARRVLDPLRGAVGLQGWRDKNGIDVREEFLSWLEGSEGDRPYFAFLNFIDAHSPYAPPIERDQRFGERADESWDAFRERWLTDPDSAYTPASARIWIDMYDTSIRFIDDQLGRIYDALKERGSLQQTLVIVTSDHGEMWGERGLFEHANTIYDPVLHVPLLISMPGTVPEGLRVAEPVSLRDLAATVLDLAGLPGLGPDRGVSLARTWSGLRSTGSPLFAQVDPHPADAIDSRYRRGDLRAFYSGSLAYVFDVDAVGEELYNLTEDPFQSEDLASAPGRSADLRGVRGMLRAFLRDVGASSEAARLPGP